MRSSRPVPFWPRQPLPALDRTETLQSLPSKVSRRESFLVELFPGLPIPADSVPVPTMPDSSSLKPIF